MSQPVNKVMAMYQKVEKLPRGKWIFSRVICRKAPYFSTVSPQLVTLRPNYCETFLRKSRKVQNHIGTFHVIAICNGLEFSMGVMAEASIPPHLRWIPKGMDVRYTAKATTDLTVVAEVADGAWERGPDVPVQVRALRADGTVVVEGCIHLWVTPKD